MAVDWEKVFAEMQKAEDAEIIADKNVKVCKLSEMDPDFVAKHAQRLVSVENKLLALHYSVNPDAQVLIIPKNTVIENPIMINSKAKVIASAENIIIIAEEGAQATIVENTTAATAIPEGQYKGQVVQLYAHPKARIEYCTMHNHPEGTNSFVTKRAEVLQDAQVTWFDVVIGTGFIQVQVRSHLRDAEAEVLQYQAIVGSKSQQCDINSEAFHEKSNTKSVMLAKGILSDNSRAMHRGTIRVEKNASACQGHQRTDLLLVGEEARGNAIPVLEVENDDVSCSHAATMGQINEEQLYYLVSRGLDEEKAKRILELAFIEPLLQKLLNEKAREECRKILQR
jgi:Fe-S cluster assembly protein SufD